MYWDDEPATEQQLLNLKNAGYAGQGPLTRTEAARLIREYHRHPGHVGVAAAPKAHAVSEESPAPKPAKAEVSAPQLGVSESARMAAYRLRVAVDQAARALAVDPAAPNVRADAAAANVRRREFWVDTCRQPREMHLGTLQVFELYRNYGCRFETPTVQQLEGILEALDSVSPLWDRDNPELFYQTLELNFPELVRR